MAKQIKSIISLLLAIVMLLSVTACGGTEDVWSEWVETVEITDDTSSQESQQMDITESTDNNISSDNTTTNNSSSKPDEPKDVINLTVNGRTKYKIVVSLANDGYDQGRLIQKVVKATTNASMPLIMDTEQNDGPEIIVGDTLRKESTDIIKTLGNNEYTIKVDSDYNIIIAATDEYSLKLATDRFLGNYLGYSETATKVGKEKPIPTNLNIKQSVFDDYKLVWSDDFNGSALNNKKWGFKEHMSPQPDLKLYSDERAVKVDNGCLNLISGRIDNDNYFTNTSVSTADTFVFKYGYLEMRAKVPFGKPAFPSFWMQSNAYNAEMYHVMSEIDIFEHFSVENRIESAIHKWYKDGTAEHFSKEVGDFNFESESLAEDWHTYGLWWTPDALNFMVDGKIYSTVDITDSGDIGERNDGMACFHDYHHIIFNNYLYTAGGSLSHPKKNATLEDKFPIVYSIDYIRLYQLPGQGGIVELNN